jgi:hypothetical protein
MSDRQAELEARAETYKKEALRAMEMAEKATTDEHRAEHLRLAVEWLRLSSEVNEMLGHTRQIAG